MLLQGVLMVYAETYALFLKLVSYNLCLKSGLVLKMEIDWVLKWEQIGVYIVLSWDIVMIGLTMLLFGRIWILELWKTVDCFK